MSRFAETVLRLCFVALGLGVVLALATDAQTLLAAVAAVAVTATLAITTASLRTLIATIVALLGTSLARRPAERIDLPASITQSRPDAPGRPRPRAPGALPAVA